MLQCSPQDTVLDMLERASPQFEAELRHVSISLKKDQAEASYSPANDSCQANKCSVQHHTHSTSILQHLPRSVHSTIACLSQCTVHNQVYCEWLWG